MCIVTYYNLKQLLLETKGDKLCRDPKASCKLSLKPELIYQGIMDPKVI